MLSIVRMAIVGMITLLAQGLAAQVSFAVATEPGDIAQDGTKPQDAEKALTPWEKVIWPWENDQGYLTKREEALIRLIAAGVVPCVRKYPAAAYQQADAPKMFAKERIGRFYTDFGGFDQFGWDPSGVPNRATDRVILENLKWFPEVQSLSLWASAVTDDGLKIVLQMPYLEDFEIQNPYPPSRPCRITDEGMKTLSQCRNIKTLSFLAVKITDAGIKYLSQLPNLEKICLKATCVTPECLRYLVRMPKLVSIVLTGNRGVSGDLDYADVADYDRLSRAMSREAIEEMGSAQGVPKYVDIRDTLAIDSSVFESLCATPTVVSISLLSASHLNDVSHLRALSGQKHLKRVECYETQNPTPEIIKTLESVDNDSVQLGVVLERVKHTQFPIREWLNWAKKVVESK